MTRWQLECRNTSYRGLPACPSCGIVLCQRSHRCAEWSTLGRRSNRRKTHYSATSWELGLLRRPRGRWGILLMRRLRDLMFSLGLIDGCEKAESYGEVRESG